MEAHAVDQVSDGPAEDERERRLETRERHGRRQRPGENGEKDATGDERQDRRARGRAEGREGTERRACVSHMRQVEEPPNHRNRVVQRDVRGHDRLRDLVQSHDGERDSEIKKPARHRWILLADDAPAAHADAVVSRLDVFPHLPAPGALRAFGRADGKGVRRALPHDERYAEYVSQFFF